MTRYNRIVIYPQDVAMITGRSDRYGRLIIQRIKKQLGKKAHQYVTIQEFATYIAVDLSIVEACIFGVQ